MPSGVIPSSLGGNKGPKGPRLLPPSGHMLPGVRPGELACPSDCPLTWTVRGQCQVKTSALVVCTWSQNTMVVAI